VPDRTQRTLHPSARPHLLVCDPRPVVRVGLRTVLADVGHVGDCPPERLADALAALPPDLVVVGVPNGDRDAYARIADLSRSFADLLVIVVPDRPDEVDERAATLAGARAVVPSDATPDRLLTMVQAVLGGSDALRGPTDASTTRDDGRVLRPRDLDVLALIADGLTNSEIAERLDMAPRTAKTHVQHLIERLGARDRTEAVARAFRLGLLR
jgi:DNA-binding NarL/FixJ family response regulator